MTLCIGLQESNIITDGSPQRPFLRSDAGLTWWILRWQWGRRQRPAARRQCGAPAGPVWTSGAAAAPKQRRHSGPCSRTRTSEKRSLRQKTFQSGMSTSIKALRISGSGWRGGVVTQAVEGNCLLPVLCFGSASRRSNRSSCFQLPPRSLSDGPSGRPLSAAPHAGLELRGGTLCCWKPLL